MPKSRPNHPTDAALRVLLASPCPTHPPIEGNARRVLRLIEALQTLGCEVHVLYLPSPAFPRPDVLAMRRAWGARFHTVDDEGGPRADYRRKIGLDQLYDASWSVKAQALQDRYGFDVAIAEYLFLSRLLSDMPAAVHKVVDTHDVFTERNARMAAAGLREPWLETTAEDETAGLNRADVVLAIQEDEAQQLRRLTDVRVVTVGHIVETVARPSPDPQGPPSVLMLGGPHSLNAQGLVWFVAEVWPLVTGVIPDAKLHVGGRLGERLPREVANMANLEVLGVLPDVVDAYARAHVVINPALAGTGLPIKAIEALAHGKAMVMTSAGARGLGEGSARGFRTADTAAEFANATTDLLRDPSVRHEMALAAHRFGIEWRERQLEALSSALPTLAARSPSATLNATLPAGGG